MADPVVGPHPFAGITYYGESPILRERRYLAAQPALAAAGFTLERPALDALAELAPWAFPVASYALALARGACDGRLIEIFEYGAMHGPKPPLAMHSHAVVLLHDRRIDGRAQVTLDPEPDKAPPGLFARVSAAMFGAEPGELEVGDAEFDRLFLVFAPSVESARRALPPELRTWLTRARFPGAVDVRPGVLMYSLPRLMLEPGGIAHLVAPAPGLLEAATVGAGRGYR